MRCRTLVAVVACAAAAGFLSPIAAAQADPDGRDCFQDECSSPEPPKGDDPPPADCDVPPCVRMPGPDGPDDPADDKDDPTEPLPDGTDDTDPPPPLDDGRTDEPTEPLPEKRDPDDGPTAAGPEPEGDTDPPPLDDGRTDGKPDPGGPASAVIGGGAYGFAR